MSRYILAVIAALGLASGIGLVVGATHELLFGKKEK